MKRICDEKAKADQHQDGVKESKCTGITRARCLHQKFCNCSGVISAFTAGASRDDVCAGVNTSGGGSSTSVTVRGHAARDMARPDSDLGICILCETKKQKGEVPGSCAVQDRQAPCAQEELKTNLERKKRHRNASLPTGIAVTLTSVKSICGIARLADTSFSLKF